ncbi:hypothetical protein [Streptomyces avermitilis]|uniref:hypothetical protein n=1 Tax=Streptomyces avermitilis TaxID=33903 RepID=UPI0020172DFA|nr:hypothetical protein [Streptomyces avermitilis]
MEVVTLGVGNAEPGGEQRTDRGLARPRDAHHHDYVGVCTCSITALAVFVDI